MPFSVSCRTTPRWLPLALQSLKAEGYAIITDVLSAAFIEDSLEAVNKTAACIREEVGEDRLRQAGELGTLRLLMRYDRHFIEFVQIPEIVAVIDAYVHPQAIMRNQLATILPAGSREKPAYYATHHFHINFPYIKHTPELALDCALLLTEMTATNGALMVAPGSHHLQSAPGADYLQAAAIPLEAPAGSALLLDGCVWHWESHNDSDRDTVYVTHQFTNPVIKPHFDYASILGEEVMRSLPLRTQELLGWHSRMPRSLDEFYVPQDKRLFKPLAPQLHL